MEIESLSLSHFSFLVLFFYPFFFFFLATNGLFLFPSSSFTDISSLWRDEESFEGNFSFFSSSPKRTKKRREFLIKIERRLFNEGWLLKLIDYLNKCLIILKFWLIFSCFVTIIEKFGDQLSKNCFSINLNNRYIRENV